MGNLLVYWKVRKNIDNLWCAERSNMDQPLLQWKVKYGQALVCLKVKESMAINTLQFFQRLAICFPLYNYITWYNNYEWITANIQRIWTMIRVKDVDVMKRIRNMRQTDLLSYFRCHFLDWWGLHSDHVGILLLGMRMCNMKQEVVTFSRHTHTQNDG